MACSSRWGDGRLTESGRKRLLYAEDDLLSRRLFSILARQAAIECDLACDGEEALAMFRAGRYDGVVLDTYMPGLDGEELAREIRRIDKKVPLVAVTSDRGAVEKLREAGVEQVFFKPRGGRECVAYLLERI